VSDSSSRPKVRVSDKRIKHGEKPKPQIAPDAPEEQKAEEERAHDYLEDLQRLQAEFDNYRRRMMQQQTQVMERASERLVEQLLPVLDNFERALAHGDGDSGLELVYRDLMSVLEAEGLEAITSHGEPFDPHLHEAVESHEDEEVSEPTVTKVYRTGYRLKGKVLRPAMVVVARPLETAPAPESPTK
jgi:molecular chaperone GrpE